MKDFEEKDEQAQKDASEQSTDQQNKGTEETNWAENQQVDEEGAEISPDDVK
jgi:hypothetical protein